VPAKWRWLLTLNPLTGLIDGFRASLFAQPFNWIGLSDLNRNNSGDSCLCGLLFLGVWSAASLTSYDSDHPGKKSQ
jgi:ABC-type polysaccharide/polyol phosphate export permease